MPDEAADALIAELIVLIEAIAREVERHDEWFAKRRRMLRGEIPAHLLPDEP